MVVAFGVSGRAFSLSPLTLLAKKAHNYSVHRLHVCARWGVECLPGNIWAGILRDGSVLVSGCDGWIPSASRPERHTMLNAGRGEGCL
ncbi:hypothetical protein ACWF99_32620 [Nocardia sp. NPDC055002]